MTLASFFIPATFTIAFSFLAAFYHYYQFNKKDLALSVAVFSLFIFLIVHFVSFEGSLGLGIGLLGILSIVRLRSTPENLIDIAFIFYSITLGLLNASVKELDVLFGVNLMMTMTLILLSSNIFFRKSILKTEITFDELLVDRLNNFHYLKKEIKDRYHIEPVNIKVKKVDYLKDAVTLEIYYIQCT